MKGTNMAKTKREILLDKASFEEWSLRENKSTQKINNKILAQIMLDHLSPHQLKYVTKYYYDGLKITEIAEMYGVNKSTVSRTIKKAEERIAKVAKYFR